MERELLADHQGTAPATTTPTVSARTIASTSAPRFAVRELVERDERIGAPLLAALGAALAWSAGEMVDSSEEVMRRLYCFSLTLAKQAADRPRPPAGHRRGCPSVVLDLTPLSAPNVRDLCLVVGDRQLYARRRASFAEAMTKGDRRGRRRSPLGAGLFRNNDVDHDYRQDSDLFYPADQVRRAACPRPGPRRERQGNRPSSSARAIPITRSGTTRAPGSMGPS